jgi:hypothetical protein
MVLRNHDADKASLAVWQAAPRDPLENITRVQFVLELPRLCC